ncbi:MULTISPECIES: hypothetical protein [Brasilonema]|uniref:hypothetical protein n=1 Tax=Brasilonema TaxID=383614 RepID=UPI00145EB6C9|nr:MULTISPECIES: hypothetical protein [Brasilonema]
MLDSEGERPFGALFVCHQTFSRYMSSDRPYTRAGVSGGNPLPKSKIWGKVAAPLWGVGRAPRWGKARAIMRSPFIKHLARNVHTTR